MKVIYRDKQPGERFFSGTGKGAISLNSRNLQKTQQDDAKAGSTTAPVAASASSEIENWLLKTAQEQIANEAAQSSTDKQGQTPSQQ